MNRRKVPKILAASLVSYTLLDTLIFKKAIPRAIIPITKHWLVQLNEYCMDLKKSAISPAEWQDLVELLFNRIALDELLELIDFENLIKQFNYPDLGVHTKMVNFPKLEGFPEDIVFIKKIFGMKKNRAIIPHGHSNMASLHLIVKGDLHLRQYEKIRQEKDALIIKPTVDKMVSLGATSSISDDKNNVHWFVAESDTAFTFDIIMLDLKGKVYDIHNLDIYEKQDLSDGTMKVPMLDVNKALKKYGKLTHH